MKPNFVCSKCDCEFPRIDVLHSHIVLQHFYSPNITYKCLNSTCTARFVTEFGMLKHMSKGHKPLNPDAPVEENFHSLKMDIYLCLHQSINKSFAKCSEQARSTTQPMDMSLNTVAPPLSTVSTANSTESDGANEPFEPFSAPAVKSEPSVGLDPETSNNVADPQTELVVKEEPSWLEEMANELDLPSSSVQSTLSLPLVPMDARQPDVSAAKTMDNEPTQAETSSDVPIIKDELDECFIIPNTSEKSKSKVVAGSSTFPGSLPRSRVPKAKVPSVDNIPDSIDMAQWNESTVPNQPLVISSANPEPLLTNYTFGLDRSKEPSDIATTSKLDVPNAKSTLANLRQNIISKIISSSEDGMRILVAPDSRKRRKCLTSKDKQILINSAGIGRNINSKTSSNHVFKRRKCVTDKERQLIINYSRTMHSVTEIAALLKCSHRRISKVLREYRETESAEKSVSSNATLPAGRPELINPQTSPSVPIIKEEHPRLSNIRAASVDSSCVAQGNEPTVANHHENVSDLRQNIMPSRTTRSAQRKIFLHAEKDPFGGVKRKPARPAHSKMPVSESDERVVSSTGQILISPKMEVPEEMPQRKPGRPKRPPVKTPSVLRKEECNAYKIGLNLPKPIDSSLVQTKFLQYRTPVELIQPRTSSSALVINQSVSSSIAPNASGKSNIADSSTFGSCDPCSSFLGAINLNAIPQKKEQVEKSPNQPTVPSENPSAPKKARRKQELPSSSRRNPVLLPKSLPMVGERDALADFTVDEFLRLKFYKI